MPDLTRRSSALRATFALVTATVLLGTGCASLVAQPRMVAVDLDRPEMQRFDVVRSMTTMERDARIETGSDKRSREVTPTVFWSGIGIGTLGAIGTVGFAVGGYVQSQRLNDLHAADSGSIDEREQIRSRGKLFDNLLITSGFVMAIGYTIALVTYAVDWNRCGAMVEHKQKRRCKEAAAVK